METSRYGIYVIFKDMCLFIPNRLLIDMKETSTTYYISDLKHKKQFMKMMSQKNDDFISKHN